MTNYLYRGKRIREDEWVYGTLEKCYNEYGETFLSNYRYYIL